MNLKNPPEVKMGVPFSVKAADVNMAERTFTGYAAAFNNIDSGYDVILPGAFQRSIDTRVAAGKVKLIDQHAYMHGNYSVFDVLGKVVEASEDSYGLFVKVYVSKGTKGDQLLEQIVDGTIDALSIGYDVPKGGAEYVEQATDEGVMVVRLLKEIALGEVSVVIWGMNELATINADSVKEQKIGKEFNVKGMALLASFVKSLEALDETEDEVVLSETDRETLSRASESISALLTKTDGAPGDGEPESHEEPADAKNQKQEVELKYDPESLRKLLES